MTRSGGQEGDGRKQQDRDRRCGRISAKGEAFEKIMAAVDRLQPDETLLLINSFEPRPLYRVMVRNGFTHWAEQTADGDWKIYFRRDADRLP
jgi:uncharacterized protein (DUF2249 family)